MIGRKRWGGRSGIGNSMEQRSGGKVGQVPPGRWVFMMWKEDKSLEPCGPGDEASPGEGGEG